jgi:hypothetical protein
MCCAFSDTGTCLMHVMILQTYVNSTARFSKIKLYNPFSRTAEGNQNRCVITPDGLVSALGIGSGANLATTS